jgi:hypothetical protein
MGNRGTMALRKVLKVRKAEMKSRSYDKHQSDKIFKNIFKENNDSYSSKKINVPFL